MNPIARLLRTLSGSGSAANARRACAEIVAGRQHEEDVANYLARVLADADRSLAERRLPA
ncbi:MAG: hypothetical protein ACYDH6_08135 [Acidimicrobiales bacterium]